MRASADGDDDAISRSAVTFAALRDANEQLVLSAVRAQIAAEASARLLDTAERAADRDVLTGLPLRTLMLDRFVQAAAIAKRHGTRLAVLFVDLNNFKQVNDALGHAVGDTVLKRAAECLLASVRDADSVSRHGGDEFIVLLTDIAQPSDAAAIADKVAVALAAPVRIRNHIVRLTASVGISLYPDHGDNAPMLIDRADAAMYLAKRRGVGSHAFFGDEPLTVLARKPTEITVLRQPVMPLSITVPEHVRRLVSLREANEQLVLTALSTQSLLEDAEDAQRRQSEFMAVLAHELRNPLAPMRNVSAMLARVKPDDPALPKLQAIIERQVAHMARMVDDLLDISRASTGKLRLEIEDVEMAAIVAESIEACRAAIDVRLQRFTVQIPPVAVFVRGDPIRLTQIVTNLLDNASRYTPNGGDLSLTLTVEGANLVLTVSDSGIGILPDALPGLFDLFAQDIHAVSFSNFGLGIGLTVVHELVTAHDGTVTAHSEGAGHGSQFVVTLPSIPDPAPPAHGLS
jgi:diguanylate cyclase